MNVTKEQLEDLYIAKGLNVRQCAEALGLPSHGGISWRLKKLGLTARVGKFQKGNQVNKGRDPEKCVGWKGGKQVVLCDTCGKQLSRFPSLIKETNFCNRVCYYKWRSENLKGEANPNHSNSVLVGDNNPNWKGGITHEPYALIWIDKRFKAGIRKRDSHTCQNPDCRGNSERLTIHHIDYDKKNCEPENLITLCVSCNARANFNRDFWEAGYSAIIRLKYEADNNLYNILTI